MASVNKAIIVGNLGKDPETRFTQSKWSAGPTPGGQLSDLPVTCMILKRPAQDQDPVSSEAKFSTEPKKGAQP